MDLSSGDEDKSDASTECSVYEVKYEVAVTDVAVMTDFNLLTTTPFREFQRTVAHHMGIPLLQLSSLGYVMSFWAKSPKPLPKLVDCDDHYESMLNELHEHILEGKNSKKKGKAKPVSIQIVDLSEKEMGTKKV